jgi:hypothetical protein
MNAAENDSRTWRFTIGGDMPDGANKLDLVEDVGHIGVIRPVIGMTGTIASPGPMPPSSGQSVGPVY